MPLGGGLHGCGRPASVGNRKCGGELWNFPDYRADKADKKADRECYHSFRWRCSRNKGEFPKYRHAPCGKYEYPYSAVSRGTRPRQLCKGKFDGVCQKFH